MTNGSSESGRQQRTQHRFLEFLPSCKKNATLKKENVRQGVGLTRRAIFHPFCEAVILHGAGLRQGDGALQQARQCGAVFVQKKENAVIEMWEAAGKCMRVHLSSQGGVWYEGTLAKKELLALLIRCVQVPASLLQNKHRPLSHTNTFSQ